MRLLAILFSVIALQVTEAPARDLSVLPGPIPAIVEKVVDGDTVRVRANIWIGQEVVVLVRVNAVDTPELSGRCESEGLRAKRAKKFVYHEIGGTTVLLRNIRKGKYAGRVIADVETESGKDLGALLLKTGHARPYAGRRYKKWCCEGGQCSKDPAAGSSISYLKVKTWLRNQYAKHF